MRLLTSLGKPFALAAVFTAAALMLDHEPVSIAQPSHAVDITPHQAAQKCHDMVLNQLGLFKDHEITLSGGQIVTINQWQCPDEIKAPTFQELSRHAYPALHDELWDKNGEPIAMTVTRTLL